MIDAAIFLAAAGAIMKQPRNLPVKFGGSVVLTLSFLLRRGPKVSMPTTVGPCCGTSIHIGDPASMMQAVTQYQGSAVKAAVVK